jgi:hypothetical protein
MDVKDPIYTAEKKQYRDKSEYWCVSIKLTEPEYRINIYEVRISLDGEEEALWTG